MPVVVLAVHEFTIGFLERVQFMPQMSPSTRNLDTVSKFCHHRMSSDKVNRSDPPEPFG